MSISSSSMLVEMNISVWTAAITDRNATAKVTDEANATADAGKFKKNLMAGTTLRKEIADYAALCRTWHNGRTLPWSDKGVRLLPTSMFLDYKQEVNSRRAYFESKVATFVAEYPQLVNAAQLNLGDLSNGADYPTAEEIASKFAFRLVFSPVPEAGDFRLTANDVDMEELKAQYASAYETRIGDAMKTTWDKLHNTLLIMSDKLTAPEGEQTKQFRSTFISNIEDMCSLLTHLNITKDPQLELARCDLQRAISNVGIEDIRADEGARTDLKAQVDAVLSRYEW
jgi:hypothetical protein